MNTPLTEAVNRYLNAARSRLHMPGHKGRPLFPVGEAAAYDITEVEGAGSLYEAAGPIAQMEENFRKTYGSAGSFVSAGGATLCIQAMLALAAGPGDKVIAGRQLHGSAVNAMALLGLEPVWVYPGYCPGLDAPGILTVRDLEPVVAAHPDAVAVYLTSPDYYGNLADIPAIAALCGRAGMLLLVDNAHGAHLIGAAGKPHPIRQGADICCDSLHKSLPVLTGGAVLHIGNPVFLKDAKRRMALFGSSSPSYLVMLSLDQAAKYLRQDLEEDIKRVGERVDALRVQAIDAGFGVAADAVDPWKLSLGFWKLGYTEREFGEYVRGHGIEPEWIAGSSAVFMFSGGNREEDFQRMSRCIANAAGAGKGSPAMRSFRPHRLGKAMPLREAVLASSEEIPVDKAGGRIAGGMVTPCPPGIPLAVPGEKLDYILVEQMKSYGILRVNVVK